MKRLTTKFMLLITLCLSPFIFLSFVHLTQSFADKQFIIEDNMRQMALSYRAEISSALRAGRYVLQTMAETEAVKTGDEQLCSRKTEQVLKHFDGYSAIARVSKEGLTDCGSRASLIGIDMKSYPSVQAALTRQRFIVSPFALGNLTKSPVIVLIHPTYRDDESFNGLVGLGIRLDWVQSILLGHLNSPGYKLTVFDQNKIVMNDMGDNKLFGPPQDIGKPLTDESLFNLAKEHGPGKIITQIGEKGLDLLYISELRDIPGNPIITIRANLASVSQINIYDIFVYAILAVSFIFISLLVAYGGTRTFLSNWLKPFSHATQALAAGNLSVRLPEESLQGSEHRHLAGLYNVMADNIVILEKSILDAHTAPAALITPDGVLLLTNKHWDQDDKTAVTTIKSGDNILRRFTQDAQEHPIFGALSIAIQSVLTGVENKSFVELPAEKDGKWYETIIAPALFQDKRGLILLLIDMSERKHLDRKLAEKSALLDRAEAMAELGHWRINLKDKNVFWSQAIYDIHGLSKQRQSIHYDEIFTFFHEDDAKSVKWIIENAIQEKKSFALEKRLVRHDGEVRIVECQGNCEFDRKKRVCALFGIMRDVTEERVKQQALEQAKLEAETLNRAKTQFLANMSHELRTPLNAIIGFSEILTMKELRNRTSDQVQTLGEDILKSGHDLLNLINDLLDMAQIEHGTVQLHETKIDIADLLEDVMTMIRDQADRTGLLVETRFGDLPQLRGDLRMLRQVLLNILGNALRFTPTGGRLVVESDYDSFGNFQIAISDTGPGIASETLRLLDHPFSLNHDPYIRGKRGAGLGLPISKALMMHHGGTLEIDSVLGKGTLIKLTFPSQRLMDMPKKTAQRVRSLIADAEP